MAERHLTPSKITAWLDCAAYLDLKHQVEAGIQAAPSLGQGSFAQLLTDKGLLHEAAVLATYRARGLRVVEAPARGDRESFSTWAKRVGPLLHATDWDVRYQFPMVHNGIRGVADFLLRQEAGHGAVTVEPVDAKLARKEAKPGHVLQLSFYAEAIAAATGTLPERMHLWLGSGDLETLLVADFDAYWQRLCSGLARTLELEVSTSAAVPEPCAHCAFCDFAGVCDARWRSGDSLVYVAGLSCADRMVLHDAGVATLDALASCTAQVPGVPEQRQSRLVAQARLQRQARAQDEALPPPFSLVQAGEDPVFGHGFAQLPEPDPGDVFLDFEGHPFWRADRGLFFLFGLIQQCADGTWEYLRWWAHHEAEEGEWTAELVEHLAERRQRHPGMHVYHYNHTERSSLEALVEDHGVAQVALTALVETGAFVDLLPVVRNAVQIGAESYGLKAVERLTGYERGHDVDAGAGAVLEYERWMCDGAQDALDAIAAYNEDDVRATRAVRDWLVQHRPADLPWRPAVLDPADDLPELDARVEALHAYGSGTPEHLLGDLLGYWRREWKAYLAPRLVACEGDTEDLLAEPTVLADLKLVGQVERLGKNGKPIRPLMRFRFPPQECALEDKVLFPVVDGPPAFADIARLDVAAGELDLVWSTGLQKQGVFPAVVAHDSWFTPRPKPAALSALADAVLNPAVAANPVALALLRGELPRFLPGRGPAGGIFTDDLDAMLGWTAALDGTCVAVQGPPGTGKTYRAARQIRALLQAGKRVGITAFSHHAIDNLLEAVVEVYRDLDELEDLHAVKKGGPATWTSGEVAHVSANRAAAAPTFALVAGTTSFCSATHYSYRRSPKRRTQERAAAARLSTSSATR
ncbi:TM0106 family RecB-like putative nuclease [Cellulomonas aerilata]|nr:TM0106 family RecB-like putative nuclease [Cellulomonas aerilata]